MTWGPRVEISPCSPKGTSFPSSSKIATSVNGNGIPMVPLNSVDAGGFAVATGEVSDKP